MLSFPVLRTGCVAQYPFGSAKTFTNDVLQFLGGDEQRYRTSPSALMAWTVRLELLDEAELQVVESLFETTSGSSATFSFIDPATNLIYPACYFSSDDLKQVFSEEGRSQTTLVIRESRS